MNLFQMNLPQLLEAAGRAFRDGRRPGAAIMLARRTGNLVEPPELLGAFQSGAKAVPYLAVRLTRGRFLIVGQQPPPDRGVRAYLAAALDWTTWREDLHPGHRPRLYRRARALALYRKQGERHDEDETCCNPWVCPPRPPRRPGG